MNRLNRTKTIGIKVSQASFEALRKLSEAQGKPLSEWCRDRVMEASMPPGPQPSDIAVIAEITATQAILIDLVCTLGRDGKVNMQKAQEIVDAAHNAKYKEAAQLLRFAYSKSAKFHLEGPGSIERPRKEEHNE